MTSKIYNRKEEAENIKESLQAMEYLERHYATQSDPDWLTETQLEILQQIDELKGKLAANQESHEVAPRNLKQTKARIKDLKKQQAFHGNIGGADQIRELLKRLKGQLGEQGLIDALKDAEEEG